MGSNVVILRGPEHPTRYDDWSLVTSLVLDGIGSHHTRRAYSQALEEFLIWFRDSPGREFNKATVQKYRTELQTKGLAPSSINVRLAAIRRLALEAADNGFVAPELAAGVARAKGVRRAGVRLGQWLTSEDAHRLLKLPNVATLKGARDRAVIALLLGAGLRRSELSRLDLSQIQQREGRWLIVDLTGKHGRIRSVPIPEWVYITIAYWTTSARIVEGAVFRAINRHGQVRQSEISPQAVFDIVKIYAAQQGIGVSPHDLRRSFAKLAHVGQSPIEQIQLSMGHASLLTTEIYLGIKQNLVDAPCDHLGLTIQCGGIIGGNSAENVRVVGRFQP